MGGFPAGRVLVDGKGVGDVGAVVLRDRQLLAEDGLVTVAIVVDRGGKMVAGPEIVSRGFVYVKESEPLLDELRAAVLAALEARPAEAPFDREAISGVMRTAVRSFINQRFQRKPVVLPLDHGALMPAAAPVSERRTSRPRRKKEARRWQREIKGIVLLLAAGFCLVALATFDPILAPSVQSGPTGPVGVWAAWGLFLALGYAGFLLPLLLTVLALGIFVRPLAPGGWAPLAGVAMLLVSTTGLLALASSAHWPAGTTEVQAGGVVGWGIVEGLRAVVGDVGTWLVVMASVPVGILFVTQVSYGALSRLLGARFLAWRRRRTASARRAAPPKSSSTRRPSRPRPRPKSRR